MQVRSASDCTKAQNEDYGDYFIESRWAQLLLDTKTATVDLDIPEPPEAEIPADGESGGTAQSRKQRKLKKKEQLAQDEQDFLDIIQLALPEILKHIDKS